MVDWFPISSVVLWLPCLSVVLWLPCLDFDGLIALLDRDGLVVGDGLGFVVLDHGDAVVLHLARFVVLHQGLEILFRLYVTSSLPFLSSNDSMLKLSALALRRAAGLDAADGLLVRQRPGRHHVRVVHAADDDRAD